MCNRSVTDENYAVVYKHQPFHLPILTSTRRLLSVYSSVLRVSPASLLELVEAEMATFTAKRQESVRLFSSDRVYLKSVQPPCICLESSVQLPCFNRVCLESV